MIDYFLGIGQSERSCEWLSREIPTVQFHEAPQYLEGKDNTDFRTIGMKAIANVFVDHAPDYIYAESQAAPAIIEAICSKAIDMPRYLVLIQPLGLNPHALGRSQRAKRRTLILRSIRFWLHPNQSLFITGNRWTVIEILKDSFRHYSRLGAAYMFGAEQDSTRQLALIARTIQVEIYASKHDMLFPYDEIFRENPELQNSMYEINGTHANRATSRGAATLRQILDKHRVI